MRGILHSKYIQSLNRLIV